MKNVYQLKEGELSMSHSHMQTQEGLIMSILAKLAVMIILIISLKTVFTEFTKYQNSGEVGKLFTAIFLFIMTLLMTRLLYYVFLQRDYRKKVQITDLKGIVVDLNYGNEVIIKILLNNSRYKKLRFRKLEKEYERFLNDVKKISNCAISYNRLNKIL
ncbi:hypothetical protein H2O64_22830 [Kordia sp. YSTF-M3]|uniref:DUF304 domain-containing protein n=1 Tax=Kordia aestuariivivens TaxID=2759037 RepID=A0ABR7QGJ1_9FLAO|nr:hypothetical protein [Kordia aestuariivivens]MBC8757523.1 hypothetical protein [Kordia aestuariivivens]